MNIDELTKDFEKIIVAWLKTNDENATNLAYLLAKEAETKQLSMRVVIAPKGMLCVCKGSGGIRIDGTCARCNKLLELSNNNA